MFLAEMIFSRNLNNMPVVCSVQVLLECRNEQQ